MGNREFARLSPGKTPMTREADIMDRDLQTAVEAFVERFGCAALTEAVSRYRDAILAGRTQQALAWRSIADAIEDHSDSQALRAIN